MPSIQDCDNQERDLDKLEPRAGTWLMKFNSTKCKVIPYFLAVVWNLLRIIFLSSLSTLV